MKKYLKYIIIIALIIIAIIVITSLRKAKNKPEFRTTTPSIGNIREIVTATGSLNPYVLVSVGTEVSGKIEKLYKDFNDNVKKGELLAKLDTEILSTNLEAAKADLAKAKTALDQAKLDYDVQTELLNKQMTPEYDAKKALFAYQNAQQSYNSAQLTLQRAQKNLANAYITSPINGIVVSRDVDEGQTVAASMSSPTLFQIANNLDQMQISADVDEADIGKITVGLPVEFTVDAYPSENFTGEVKQIRLNPNTESNVVSYSVIIDAANPEQKLLPGMTTNVTIIIQSRENVTRISETATRFKPSKEVWEQFGLKWSDDLIQKAQKEAFASLASSKSSSAKDDSTASNKKTGKSKNIQHSSNKASTKSKNALVWVLENNIPKPKGIKTGISESGYVEVIEGLSGNEVLITGVNSKNNTESTNGNSGGPGMRRF
ncbi:MAG TPA: efflux RND transporter periplasmic adaptor subunit [Candidatus Cloacimonas sp.]|nr:efflux RND transporter periplasmic adaptor subunit [Candidatus Cloacimonas sp.]HQO18094.1 efflux RND transporter periplasmic adaptor subunit [Candidatus Cloacimonas sp.]